MRKIMDKRQRELSKLKAYTNNIEKEVTLLLQNLQWELKRITEKRPMVTCVHDLNHRIPLDDRDAHENRCYLTKLGYSTEDSFLPDPVAPDANTLVKFTKHEIAEIINNAAIEDPLFRRGVGWPGPEPHPLTAERLQATYSADERRAIHSAVVDAAPFCHDLTGLDLFSSNHEAKTSQKSRLEILSELRNMKRRRAKYRVAPKTRNYSDVLRDVIKTQMDSFGEATSTIIKTEYGPNIHVSQKAANTSLDVSPEIKLERESPETCYFNRYQSEDPREGYRARSRERRYNDDRRGFHKDNISSKERNTNYDDSHHSEHSTGFSSDLSRSREKRYVDDERRHHKDKYSSKERRRNYEESYQSEDSRDRSRGKRYDDNRSSYHKDYSSKGMTKTYENYRRSGKAKHDIVIKQERASQEPESYKDYTSDRYRGRSRSRERRHHDYKNAYSKHSHKEGNEKKDRRESNHENYSTIRNIKQEIELHNDDSYDNNERSRKRYRERSRSKEKPNKDNQKKHKVDKHSVRSKEHVCRREPPPGITIKQERESP